MKGKSIFTDNEANLIIALIRKKLIADSNEQKKIRDKIRAMGFYASDFGIGGGYNENDFKRVVKIIEDDTKPLSAKSNDIMKPSGGKRDNSDEKYIIDLCDKVLKQTSNRQFRFDFLKGDSGTPLPVDAFYESLNLVIEYKEKQHTEDVKFFNRRQTVSGVTRGEQRKIYDQRRRDILPQHKIKLIEFGYDEFEHTKSKKLIRNQESDFQIIIEKPNIFIENI